MSAIPSSNYLNIGFGSLLLGGKGQPAAVQGGENTEYKSSSNVDLVERLNKLDGGMYTQSVNSVQGQSSPVDLVSRLDSINCELTPKVKDEFRGNNLMIDKA